MLRRPVFVLVTLALVVVGASGSSAESRAPASRIAIGDGFRVATGTRLLGGAIPRIPYAGVIPGWDAVLWVDTDAVSVANAYARQAGRLGFHGDSPRCGTEDAPYGLFRGAGLFGVSAQPEPTDAFSCRAEWAISTARFTIRVMVCGDCVHPVAVAEVGLGRVNAPLTGPLAAPAPPESATARLTARQQTQARKVTPDVGMRFTRELGVGEFPVVVRNSQALAPSLAFDRCVTGDVEAILSVTRGSAGAVVAALRRQSTSSDALRAPASAVVDGVKVTRVSYAYYTTITVVEGRTDPFIEIEWCND